MDELTPEQDKALDRVVDFFVDYGKAFEGLTTELKTAKIPAPDAPRMLAELAKKILAREDCPEMFRMPLPILTEYMHKVLHVSYEKDEAIEKLR